MFFLEEHIPKFLNDLTKGSFGICIFKPIASGRCCDQTIESGRNSIETSGRLFGTVLYLHLASLKSLDATASGPYRILGRVTKSALKFFPTCCIYIRIYWQLRDYGDSRDTIAGLTTNNPNRFVANILKQILFFSSNNIYFLFK